MGSYLDREFPRRELGTYSPCARSMVATGAATATRFPAERIYAPRMWIERLNSCTFPCRTNSESKEDTYHICGLNIGLTSFSGSLMSATRMLTSNSLDVSMMPPQTTRIIRTWSLNLPPTMDSHNRPTSVSMIERGGPVSTMANCHRLVKSTSRRT